MSNFECKTYQLLSDLKTDPYVIRRNQFVLQPHQVVPKYYLLSHPDLNTLILHYSLGSGKSAAAMFILIYNINIYKIFKFNTQFIQDSEFFKRHTVNRNVIVVGSWQTAAQFTQELLRPEFGYVDEYTMNDLNRLLKSPIEEQREEGKTKRNILLHEINQNIQFKGYQAFFNMVFPNVQSGQYAQDITVLVNGYLSGELTVSENFIRQSKNNIIIVDEMQRLYSSSGLNSYGFAVACVNRIAKENNIKIVYLSGTMINTSLGEIPDIMNLIIDHNIFRNDKSFISKSDICKEDVILDNVTVYKLKDELLENIRSIFKPHFMYYNQSSDVIQPEIVNVNKLKGIYIANDNLNAMIYPKRSELLPIELHIGNKLISDVTTKQPMYVYAVQLEGEQAEAYKQYVSNNIANNIDILADDITDTDKSRSVSIQDAIIPPSNKWSKLGIYKYEDVYYGKFLDLSLLRNYSAIGYEFAKIVFENAWNNEKTVVYHNRLNNFGIKQYGAILRYNGFIRYGESPSKDALCKECRGKYSDHALDLEERLKRKICNHFKPLCYDMLTGDLDQRDRDNITNNIYNSPNNLYGDLIDVMFVSDVAYAGVSFFNTNNLMILSRIPNISKWKQIYGRIIRTKSHSLLPKDKQYAKIYTFIVELPNETKIFPKLNKTTYGERYYKLRSLLNLDILDFTKYLSDDCISKDLLEHPAEHQYTKEEVDILLRLYNSDIEAEIEKIVQRMMPDNNTSIWELDTLISRIKDSSLSTSYLNLSIVPSYIIKDRILKVKVISADEHSRNVERMIDKFTGGNSVMTSTNINNLLTTFKFKNDDVIYVQLNKATEAAPEESVVKFPFTAINQINIKKTALNKLFLELDKLYHDDVNKSINYTVKVDILSRIIKLLGNKFEQLADKQAFWDFMYDIGNEYYADDEVNFVHNHTRSNRSRGKFVGCYNNQVIIFKDGTSKQINYTFPVVKGIDSIPYKFKITCLANSSMSPFYIHVVVIKTEDQSNISDRRKINKGLVCISMNTDELHKYFPKIDKTLHKKKYCNELIYEVCELQNKTKEKFIYSPFEK